MLSYRHAFHAGNHADVLKHLILVLTLDYLNQKEKAWWFVDSHAGAGIYDLDSDYARKRSEFDSGIGRLWQLPKPPAELAGYLDLVRRLNPDGRLRLYPGSPWLASRLARPGDQLRLFELHSTDSQLLFQTLGDSGRHIKVEAMDGFQGLRVVLPPPSRRGLVLIDPSYELKEDYHKVVVALKEALRRFATGIYAVWYPQLQRGDAHRLLERLKTLPAKGWLHVALTVRSPSPDGFGMHGSGMFLLNPPWTLAERLARVMPELVTCLGQDDGAGFILEHQEHA